MCYLAVTQNPKNKPVDKLRRRELWGYALLDPLLAGMVSGHWEPGRAKSTEVPEFVVPNPREECAQLCAPFAYKLVLLDSARDHPTLDAQDAANSWGTGV